MDDLLLSEVVLGSELTFGELLSRLVEQRDLAFTYLVVGFEVGRRRDERQQTISSELVGPVLIDGLSACLLELFVLAVRAVCVEDDGRLHRAVSTWDRTFVGTQCSFVSYVSGRVYYCSSYRVLIQAIALRCLRVTLARGKSQCQYCE